MRSRTVLQEQLFGKPAEEIFGAGCGKKRRA
jgi:hypothetical protein